MVQSVDKPVPQSATLYAFTLYIAYKLLLSSRPSYCRPDWNRLEFAEGCLG